MPTERVIQGVEGQVLVDTTGLDVPTVALPNNSFGVYQFGGVQSPVRTIGLSSVQLIIKRKHTGNARLRFQFIHSKPEVLPASTTIDLDNYAPYAGGGSDGQLEAVSVPSAVFDGLSGIGPGQFFVLVVERDGVNAADTYEADFLIAYAQFLFLTTAVAVAPGTLIPNTSAYLLSVISDFRLFNRGRVQLEPDRVLLAGSLAQREICSEFPLLEKYGNLALVGGQERYQFEPIAVTLATNANPIVLTVAGHKFHTGDTGVVAGAKGNDAANGDWTFTKVDNNNISLDGSVGSGAYTEGGTVYHSLLAAVKVKFFRRTTAPYGRLAEKHVTQVEDERKQYGDSSTAGEVNSFYQVLDEPLIVGFRGVPETSLLTEFLYQRIPLPVEDLSFADPIIPSQFFKLLYRGTLYHTLDLLDLPEIGEDIEIARLKYEEEKKRVEIIRGMTKRVRKIMPARMVWN